MQQSTTNKNYIKAAFENADLVKQGVKLYAL